MSKYLDIENVNVSDFVIVWECNCSEYGKQEVMAIDDLRYLPVADVAKVKHGKWVDAYGNYKTAECSQCKELFGVTFDNEANRELWNGFKSFYNYCPSCGAKMDMNG